MTLWAGLLRRAASGHGAQSREEEQGGAPLHVCSPPSPGAPGCPSALPLVSQRLRTGLGVGGTWGGWGSQLGGRLAGQLRLYRPLELMRAQEAHRRASRLCSPQSC